MITQIDALGGNFHSKIDAPNMVQPKKSMHLE